MLVFHSLKVPSTVGCGLTSSQTAD